MESLLELEEQIFKSEKDLYHTLKHSQVLENLYQNLDNENRIACVFMLDSFLKHLDQKDPLTDEDIKIARLIVSQILDQLEVIRDKGLHNYLKSVKDKLESYLEGYYNKYGYLPPYSYYEDSYRQRREYHPYNYPYKTYFKQKYPPKKGQYVEKKLTGLDIKDGVKDQIIDYLERPVKRDLHPDPEIAKVLEYTAHKLEQDLKELRERNKHLKQLDNSKSKQELSKDNSKEHIIDLIVEGLKRSKIGEM